MHSSTASAVWPSTHPIARIRSRSQLRSYPLISTDTSTLIAFEYVVKLETAANVARLLRARSRAYLSQLPTRSACAREI
jgi:hypothetical protein